MKKILYIIAVIISISGYTLSGQTGQFEGLNYMELTTKTISIAKEGLLKYAPEFYREYAYPQYNTGGVILIVADSDRPGLYLKLHAVTFFYDPSKETMENDFAATVLINDESGRVTDILLGNGMLLSGLDGANGQSIKRERSTPHWVKGKTRYEFNTYTDEGRTELVEFAKNEALWGQYKDSRENQRLDQEFEYLDDSLRREDSKILAMIRSYRDKENPNFKLSKEEKKIAIDKLRKQQNELTRRRDEARDKDDKRRKAVALEYNRRWEEANKEQNRRIDEEIAKNRSL